MPPTISIAIATYRRPEFLRELLNSIQREVEEDPLSVEIIVSDNASGDTTLEAVRSFTNLDINYVCNETNVGAVENVIRAYSKCTGDYVLLMGDDDLISPGTLRRIKNAADSADPPGLVTGPVMGISVTGVPLNEKVRFPNVAGVNRLFSSGQDAVEHSFLRASTLSGLAIRRELADANTARKYAATLYPQMHMAGVAARDGGVIYLADPVALIRDNPERDWSYSGDLMSSGVLEILGEVTEGAEWGQAVRKRVTALRIRAAYGPLYEARSVSFGTFLRLFKGLASVSQYRRSPVFWAIGLTVGAFGIRGVRLIRRVVKIAGPDHVK